MKAILFATGAVLLAFAGLASSGHGCNGDVTEVGGVLYIDVRDPATQDVWVYLESNGEAGLQSGGAGPFNGIGGLIHYDALCDHASHDTLLY